MNETKDQNKQVRKQLEDLKAKHKKDLRLLFCKLDKIDEATIKFRKIIRDLLHE